MISVRSKVAAAVVTVATLAVPGIASAHVVVKPAQVAVGEYQTFAVNVPNEKDQPTTAVKLKVPSGLHYVQPNVKPGWEVNVVKSGDTVTEIDWTGGSIPADQRDEFAFAAQAPANATELDWKAYQTYDDGTVVSWDQKPTTKDDESVTPYSVTKVVNDLSASSTVDSKQNNTASTVAIVLAAAAIVISAGSLVLRAKR